MSPPARNVEKECDAVRKFEKFQQPYKAERSDAGISPPEKMKRRSAKQRQKLGNKASQKSAAAIC